MKEKKSLIIVIFSVIVSMVFFSSIVLAKAPKGPKPKVIKVIRANDEKPKNKGRQGETLDIIVKGRNFVCTGTPTYNDPIDSVPSVKSILDDKCTGCHSPSGTPEPQKPYLNTYKGAYKARNKIVEATSEGGTMSGILTPEEKATIDAWVAGGAPLSGTRELTLTMGDGIDV